jgi:flagellar biosynthesis/type III secretory pathway M-ring protein FliF/YscJ
MDSLKSQLDRAARHVAALSSGQKIVALVLIAVIVGTSALGIRRATTGAMEPVLDQPFADADLSQITARLASRGVAYKVDAGKVLVPADQKVSVLSDLLYADVLTGNNESGFDALVKQSSPWDLPSKTDKMFIHARELALQDVIRHFQGVRKATVIIDNRSERRIGDSIVPSALVDIQTRGNADRRQLASAAVNALTGAQSNLSRDRVKVTIDGASANPSSGMEMDGGGDAFEQKQKVEQIYAMKVRSLLSYIPDLLVSVSVDLDLQTREQEKRTIDPENVVHEEIKSETVSRPAPPVSADSSPPMVNAVPAMTGGAGANAAASSEETKKEYQLLAGETVEKSHIPAGRETIVAASVAVPRSYFVQLFKRANPALEREPDDRLIQPIADAQVAKIRSLVKSCLGLSDDAKVVVETYVDVESASPPAPVAMAPKPASLVSLNGQGRNIALAGLALAGVVAVWVISRRTRAATRAPARQAGPGVAGRPVLRTPRGRLDHREDSPPDESRYAGVAAPESQDVFDRALSVVKEDPDAAADIVRRWVYQSQEAD